MSNYIQSQKAKPIIFGCRANFLTFSVDKRKCKYTNMTIKEDISKVGSLDKQQHPKRNQGGAGGKCLGIFRTSSRSLSFSKISKREDM
jgi:hypothetical protein